jgi:hypothetical protein
MHIKVRNSTEKRRVMPDGHDLPPEFSPQFIDPTCYNASFFSAIPDFDMH